MKTTVFVTGISFALGTMLIVFLINIFSPQANNAYQTHGYARVYLMKSGNCSVQLYVPAVLTQRQIDLLDKRKLLEIKNEIENESLRVYINADTVIALDSNWEIYIK